MHFRNNKETKSTGVERVVGIDPVRIGQFLSIGTKSKEVKEEEAKRRKTLEVKENILLGIKRKDLLEGELGVDDSGGILNIEEKESYITSIREFEQIQTDKDYTESCVVFLGMPKSLEIYKVLHLSWTADYEQMKKDDPKFRALSFNEDHYKEYMKKKGMAYISEVAKVMRGQLVESVFIGKKDELLADEKVKANNITAKVENFAEQRREELRVAKDDELKNLYNEFKALFTPEELEGIKDKAILDLFEDIVTNVIFEHLSLEEMDVISDTMLKYVNSDISKEDWDKLLQKTLEERAKGDLKKHIEQVAQYASSGGGVSFSSSGEQLYTDVSNMAKKCGVYLEKVGPGVYKIRYGAFKDTSFSPTIKINEDGRTFELRSQYVDKDKQTFEYGEFQYIANWQLLEHELEFNRNVQSSSVDRSSDVNSLIDDDRMIKLAEKLFGFDLGSKPLNKQHKMIYGRFIKVLLGDRHGTLVERVKQFEEFIDRSPSNNSVKLMNVLRMAGSQINTMDNLLEVASMSESKKGRGIVV